MKLGLPLQEPAVPTSDRRLGVDVQLEVRSRGAWHNRLTDQARLEQISAALLE